MVYYISIHAAREGGDSATIYTNTKCGISIHAAREGGDAFALMMVLNTTYFNPRRP